MVRRVAMTQRCSKSAKGYGSKPRKVQHEGKESVLIRGDRPEGSEALATVIERRR